MEEQTLGNIVYLQDRFKPELVSAPVNSVALTPCMSAVEYARIITQHQDTAKKFPDAVIGAPSTEEFIETVHEGFVSLLQDRPVKEIGRAMTSMIRYGQNLKTSFIASKFNPDSSAYLAWTGKLRLLSGESTDHKPEVVYVPKEDGYIHSTRIFWLDIYSHTKPGKFLEAKFENYLLNGEIASKDPVILGNLLASMDMYPIEDVLFNIPLANSRTRLVEGSNKIYQKIIEEADKAGWKNATVLRSIISNETEFSGVSGEGLIIWVGNQASRIINAMHGPKTGINLDELDIDDPYNVAEAIRRSLCFIFKYDKERHPVDPVNFLLMGGLISKFMEQAAKLNKRRSSDRL